MSSTCRCTTGNNVIIIRCIVHCGLFLRKRDLNGDGRVISIQRTHHCTVLTSVTVWDDSRELVLWNSYFNGRTRTFFLNQRKYELGGIYHVRTFPLIDVVDIVGSTVWAYSENYVPSSSTSVLPRILNKLLTYFHRIPPLQGISSALLSFPMQKIRYMSRC